MYETMFHREVLHTCENLPEKYQNLLETLYSMITQVYSLQPSPIVFFAGPYDFKQKFCEKFTAFYLSFLILARKLNNFQKYDKHTNLNDKDIWDKEQSSPIYVWIWSYRLLLNKCYKNYFCIALF